MRHLLHYLKNYKKESILAPLFKLFEASFELLIPLVMASIIDIGIASQDIPHIVKMCIVMVSLGIIGLICSITAQYFAAKASVSFGSALRKNLFNHILHFSYPDMDTHGSSTLITRITHDVNQIEMGVNLFLRLFLRSPFIVFGAMIMAFTVNVRAAFVFVVAIPVLSFVVFGIMLLTMPLYKRIQKKLDQILLITRENLVGVRVIRAFCRQGKEREAFQNASEEFMAFQVLAGKLSAVLNPLTYVLVNAALIAIIWIGGLEVDSGILTQGEVIALVNYMSQILVELIKLINLIITFTKALASANRVWETFEVSPSIMEAPSPHTGDTSSNVAVCFQDVSFSYYKGQETASDVHANSERDTLLERINFSVAKGETVGIIGGTGSGKTSMVNLIPRFYDTTAGSILVNGTDVREYSLRQLRKHIGIVPQKAVLFKGTIRDNMKWGKKDATDEEIYKALQIAQAKEIVDTKPDGLDYFITQGGKNLSGGQRQRLTIARALIKNPSILILDDSASALDFATDARLRKAIAENTGEMTVFLISQRFSTVKNADHILVLEDGNMVGFGTHTELFQTCDVYREICLSQSSNEEAKNL